MGLIKSSAKVLGAKLRAMAIPKDVPRLFCVAMVRNEIDILDPWLNHLEALFDDILIFDHLSSDGTREALSARAATSTKLQVRHFDNPGYLQSELMSAALAEIATREDRGWVFFLDADEFILGHDGTSLRQLLIRHRALHSVRLRWINAYDPTFSGRLSAETELRGWVSPAYPKIAVNLRGLPAGAGVVQGNHKLLIEGTEHHYTPEVMHLLHVPIRTPLQLRRKLDTGIAANAAADPKGAFAKHWRYIAERSEDATLGTLRDVVYGYGAGEQIGRAALAPQIPAETLTGRFGSLVTSGTAGVRH